MIRAFFDLETDGLLPTVTKVHCLSISIDGKLMRYVGNDVCDALEILDTCDEIVGHNIIGFDLMVLWLLFRWKPKARVVDTMILSCLVHPDIFGGHSLEEWGKRTGTLKTDYHAAYKAWKAPLEGWSYEAGEEWREYNPIMGDYCDDDVRATVATHSAIRSDMRGWFPKPGKARVAWDKVLVEAGLPAGGSYWAAAEHMEHEFAKHFAVQSWRGVYVDKPHTERCVAEWTVEMERIAAEVEPLLPEKPGTKGQIDAVTPPKVRFKKDGSPSVHCLRFCALHGLTPDQVGTEPLRTSFPMKLSDQAALKAWLMEAGWAPTMWSYKKAPDKNGKMRIVRGDDGKPIPTQPKFHDHGTICPNLERMLNDQEGIQSRMVSREQGPAPGIQSCVASSQPGKGASFAKELEVSLPRETERVLQQVAKQQSGQGSAGGGQEPRKAGGQGVQPRVVGHRDTTSVSGLGYAAGVEPGAEEDRQQPLPRPAGQRQGVHARERPGHQQPCQQVEEQCNPPRTGSPRQIHAADIRAVVRWMIVRHRLGFAQGVLSSLRPDGAVSATGFALGTPTTRVAHTAPLANVPKAEKEVLYGKECRAMFRARPGRKQVGVDAAGLELRCLAARVGSKAIIEMIVNGKKEDGTEIHTFLYNTCKPLSPSRTIQKNINYCVPGDTQALTRNGWKFRHELQVGDLVLTYNQAKNVKEWKPILALHDTEAEVIRLRHSHSFDVRATPDHKWFVRQRTGRSHKYMEPGIRTTETLTTESNIIANAPMTEDSGGGADWRGEKYGRNWTAEVLAMSSAQRRAFLSGFLIADGHRNDAGGWSFSQLRNEHYEAALTAAYIEHDGFLSVSSQVQPNGKEKLCVRLQTKGHVTGQRLTKSSEGVQPVWCMTTQNGSWVMRQGDCITITGNCWLYGGSDTKLGQTAGHPDGKAEAVGAEIRRRLVAAIPGLEEFMKLVEAAAKRGYIKALDGRRIAIRSKHAALNTLLQSDGSILVKHATVYMNEEIRRLRLDAWQILHYHDEVGLDCHPAHAQQAGQLFIDGLRLAGQRFRFRCPLDGEIKIGNNWAECH